MVDTGDYAVWRKSVGQLTLNNRSTGISGPVGQADYDFWRSRFGIIAPNVGDPGAVWFDNASLVLLTASPGSGAGLSAVPETPSWCLATLASLVVAGLVRRR